MGMKNVIKVEEVFMLGLAVYLFTGLEAAWWWYPVLFLAPDLGMIGYLGGPRSGAFTYNFVHHKGLAVILYVLGAVLSSTVLQLIGVVILGHSSFDRVMNYGLKYADDFKHTHLGWIGGSERQGNA